MKNLFKVKLAVPCKKSGCRGHVVYELKPDACFVANCTTCNTQYWLSPELDTPIEPSSHDDEFFQSIICPTCTATYYYTKADLFLMDLLVHSCQCCGARLSLMSDSVDDYGGWTVDAAVLERYDIDDLCETFSDLFDDDDEVDENDDNIYMDDYDGPSDAELSEPMNYTEEVDYERD